METKDHVVIVSGPLSPKRVMTQEDIIQALNVDMTTFNIEKCVVNKRDTSMRGDKGEIIISENYQVKLFLVPKIKADLVEISHILEEMLPKIQEVPALHLEQNGKNAMLGSIMLADAHIDKLDIKDVPIKKKISQIRNAIGRLMDKMTKYGVDELLFANMGDYFNSDHSMKTTKGTQQENNISEMDAWKYGFELQVEILQIMKQVAHVSAMFLPGNHDWYKLQYLRDMCSVYYKNDQNVDIMKSDKERLYYPRGKTLLGFTHGANAKEKDLPMIANIENKGKHDMVELFKGHTHQTKKMQFPGAVVETIPQASGSNQWASNNGYDLSDPSISGFIHGKKTGREAQFIEKI